MLRRLRRIALVSASLLPIATFTSKARAQTTPKSTTSTQTATTTTTTTTTTQTKTTTTTAQPPPQPNPQPQEKHGGDHNAGKTGDNKTQEKPKGHGDQGVNKKKSGCCACVVKLELEYIGPRHDRTTQKILDDPLGINDPKVKPGTPIYGDEFKLKIYYRNKLVEDADENGELSLEWYETTSRALYGNSFPIGVATDVIDWLQKNKPEGLEGPTFHPWIHRKTAKTECPAPPPGQLTPPHIEIDDKPVTIVGASRTLEFKFVVKSTPKCKTDEKTRKELACAESLTLTAKQVLENDGKTGRSTFYGPNGAPMTNGQVVSVP